MEQNKKFTFILILGLLFFYVISFFFRTDYSFDQDLGRHLKLGEIISTSLRVPTTNLFSYTFPDFQFINHHYLFEVLIYQGQKIIGLEGLLIVKILLVLLSIYLTLATVKKKNWILVLPLGYLYLHVLRDRTELRPEILSFLFTASTYFILKKYEDTKSKLIYLLPIIQLLWVNSHIYFPVGIGLQLIFLISFIFNKEFIKAKMLGLILSISAVATLVNPNFLKGALYPLQVFGNYGYTIAENQNMFLLESLNFHNPNYLFVKVIILVIVSSLIYAFFSKNLTIKNLLLSLFGLLLALMHVRSFPYLVFICLPATIANFSSIKNSFWLSAIGIIAAFLLFFESTLYLTGDYYKYTDSYAQPTLTTGEHAKGALDFVLANNLPQPIFNNFDIGSYIIYRGYPQYKVFVDGRPEGYPANYFQETYIPMQNDPKIFKEIDEKIGFKTIIFSHTDQTPWAKTFLQSVLQNSEWKVVYLDDFMIILVKSGIVEQNKITIVDLKNVSPEQYNFTNHASFLRLGLFLLNSGYTDQAKAFTQKTLSIFPDSPTANLIMASIYSQNKDYLSIPTAERYYQKAQNLVWW